MNSKKKRLKIGFLTCSDPKNIKSWSGTHFYMNKALQKHCGDVVCLGPVKFKWEIIYEKLYFRFKILQKYDYKHSTFLSKQYAKYFSKKILGQSFDLIIAPAACTEIAFLNTKIPIIYLSDATLALLNNYYQQFKNLLKISVLEINNIEKMAIQKASLILYPSEWVKQSAISDYHKNASKIYIVPFGANIDKVPDKELIFKKQKSDRCKLLFIGANWERKGGEIAFETLLKLEELGLKSELIICGCIPPKGFSHEKMKIIPFLDKNDEIQQEKLNDLFMQADFLLLPTRSDCSPIVFCEANAFGLPVITTDTGGVSGVIKNEENGYMLSESATGFEYAKLIYSIYQNDQQYYKLIKSSREMFDVKLNWDAWGARVKEIIFQNYDF